MSPTQAPPEFSLVLGGPLFQLYRRTHLSGDALELLRRRVLVITLIAWLPPLFLSVLNGHVLGGANISFLHDIQTHVRFLIALPALIIAEPIANSLLGPAIRRFIERRIVLTEDLPRFNAAVNSALRARNSFTVELILLFLVYTLGFWIWRNQIASETATWYAMPDATGSHLTLAGCWYAFVSIPIYQFILLRWYIRIVIWFRLLWQVSRLNLHLTAAHPDEAGGIGFLGKSSRAFAPILFAQGAMLSGLIASRIFYHGSNLMSFRMEAAALVVFLVLCILGPLVMFTPKLASTKRKSRAEYGLLANRYVFGFEERWIRGAAPESSQLLGTPDLQSLADLANSYSVVRQMRIVPFGREDIMQLAGVTVAPLLPLALTIFSPAQLLTLLMKVLFP